MTRNRSCAGGRARTPLSIIVGNEYYNIFRWYRAGRGRYTQADSIGLSASTNLYGYVDGIPSMLAIPAAQTKSLIDRASVSM